MSGHAMIGALTGFVVLAAHALISGMAAPALGVWLLSTMAGFLASFVVFSLMRPKTATVRHHQISRTAPHRVALRATTSPAGQGARLQPLRAEPVAVKSG